LPYWAGVSVLFGTGISSEFLAVPVMFKRDNVFEKLKNGVGRQVSRTLTQIFQDD
jgi:hypothetical protein